MPEETFVERQEESISSHIFSVSASMVGVCIMALGLFSIFQSLEKIKNISDELLAVDAVLFLCSCLISYTAVRTKDTKRRYKLERIADIVFLTALSVIALVAILIAWVFI